MKLILSFLMFLTVSASSQSKDSIIGKWKFVQVLDSVKHDDRHIYEEEMWYGKMTLHFKTNNHYKVFIMGTDEEGIWNYEDNAKEIILTSNKGVVSQINVVKLSSNKLTIRIGEPTFILERAKSTDESDIENYVKKSEAISATKKQISKKWIFKYCEQDSDSKTELAVAISEAMKGTYYYFQESGKYEALLSMDTVSGQWTFGKDNKSVILTTSNDKFRSNVWDIKSISETELVLMKGKDTDGLSFKFSVFQ